MPMFRRRPLMRAAMIGGGAYAAGKHRQRSHDEEQAQYEPEPAAAPAPAAPAGGMTGDAIEQLKQLGQLHDQGVLTDEEFAAQKQKVLGS